LPDDGSHIVKPDTFAKLDDLGTNGNYLVTPVINSACKLIANIDAQPAPIIKHPIALFPNQIQIIDVGLVVLVIPNLVFGAVIFQLPVRRRCNYKLNRSVWNQIHLTAVTIYDFMRGQYFGLKKNLFIVIKCLTI
jgi:hypothetical protein